MERISADVIPRNLVPTVAIIVPFYGFFFIRMIDQPSRCQRAECGRLLWSKLYAVRLRALENNTNALLPPLIIFIVNQRVVFFFSFVSLSPSSPTSPPCFSFSSTLTLLLERPWTYFLPSKILRSAKGNTPFLCVWSRNAVYT